METRRIFLCCGAGMSSGFLAQSMRKAAKKRKIAVEIKAASESTVDSYINKVDIVLLGPHMTYLIDELRDKSERHNVKMEVIPKEIYGELDGNALLDWVLEKLQ
ncbi:PTS sugar transporter subunit IIB [Amphibacillus sp. Q70]|uniref:PTS sugar transporter subunit IIB n=1 Tax=Amphibacillus sp. Q70 TaxID=3453416 RepID=UPI003F839CE2